MFALGLCQSFKFILDSSGFGQQVALENPSKTPLGLWMANLNETVVLFRHSLI